MNRQITLVISLVAVLASDRAFAAAPVFIANCPKGITASSDGRGHATVNGKSAKIKAVGNAWEVKGGGVIISVGGEPLTADYTGPHRANGICQISVTPNTAPGVASDKCPVDVSEADRYKYPACK